MPTLINTLGATNANSYVGTVAEAAALLDGQLVSRAAWDAATDDARARALITAARQIDTVVTWEGSKQLDTQGMQWPRWNFAARGYIKYGPGLGDSFPLTYPPMLPLMQALLAAHLLERQAAGQTPGGVDTTATIKRIEAGSVKLEYRDGITYVAGFSIPDEIFVLARPWGVRLGLGGTQIEVTR